jgi:hypothetical protein
MARLIKKGKAAIVMVDGGVFFATIVRVRGDWIQIVSVQSLGGDGQREDAEDGVLNLSHVAAVQVMPTGEADG